ncbi:MAG: zinc ribbon domain-containing protein [Methanomassiliicoccales archaeon]|nr:zinc ribbon domain-containing protein [Methanomassiliicoccales archaeon]
MATISCPKCGARVEFDAGTKFTKCSHCGTEIYIDRSGAGFYYIIPFNVKENDAVGIFKRWAAGSTKAKDLDKLAQIGVMKKEYFPVYMFKRDVSGKEEVHVEPAGSTTLPGLHNLKIPAGDLKIFDEKFDLVGAKLITPDIEMSPYLGSLPGKAKEQALVYFPIWEVYYVFNGKKYEIVIDASSGEVFSSEFPARGSGAYLVVAVVGFLAFIGEGLLATVNLPIALIAMAATVVGIFASALFVARRM